MIWKDKNPNKNLLRLWTQTYIIRLAMALECEISTRKWPGYRIITDDGWIFSPSTPLGFSFQKEHQISLPLSSRKIKKSPFRGSRPTPATAWIRHWVKVAPPWCVGAVRGVGSSTLNCGGCKGLKQAHQHWCFGGGGVRCITSPPWYVRAVDSPTLIYVVCQGSR